MGCGTSKDVQPLPSQSRMQTSLPKDTRSQQPQQGTEQAISTGTDDDTSHHLASKVAAESPNTLLIGADSSCARQARQPSASQATYQTPHSIEQGSNVRVQAAAPEPAAALQPMPTSSTCPVKSPSQGKTFSENNGSRGPELHIEQIGGRAARHEEEVQPFEESVAAAPAVAGTKSEGSPWAYLQKTYSNMDEAEQRTSETKGQHDCPQGDGPSFAELHAVNGAAMSVQAGSIPIQSLASGPNVWSRNVPENAWGDAAAVSSFAAISDAAQHPLIEPSVITSVQAQSVVDDLGMEDVDEFEAELAALSNVKSA